MFLQQPWGMRDYPRRMIGRALSCYMHYGFMMMAHHEMHYNVGTFHSYLWKYFTQTEGHRLMHIQHDPSAYNKILVTGYPKLDVYLDEGELADCDIWKGSDSSKEIKRIIYAPHHSLGKDQLRMSTFDWMHETMLELAVKTKGVQWLYKPHPNLKYSVEKNSVMSRSEYKKYEQSWANLPNGVVYDQGEYFNIFKTSDMLITDCGSFLAEYLPTKNPIIWLIAENTVGLNAVGEKMASSFYNVKNLQEFKEVFSELIEKGEDNLKDERLKAAEMLFPVKKKSSEVVVDYLKKVFKST